MMLRILLVLALVLAAAGCRQEARPTTPPQPPPEPVAPGATLPEAMRTEETAIAEVRQHSLTVPEVQRYGRVAETVHQLAAQDPELRRLEEDFEDRLARAQSIDEMQQILDEHPRVQQALREAGISSRDYVLTGTALLGAYTYVLMQEQGVPEPYRPDYVTDEHVRFIEQNRADVDAVVARLQAIYGTDLDDLLNDFE